MTEARRRRELVAARVDRQEKQIIQEMADTDGKHVGAFLRDLALAEHRRRERRHAKREQQ